MSRFLPYSPDQAYLLPPSVKDELGEDHLSVFLHRVVERLDMTEFENAYSDEGGELYAPTLMLKVWLYAYALGITSARRLEQRIREDLGLRYLAGGQRPGQLGVKRVPAAARAGAERPVYAGGGDGAGVGFGTAAAGGVAAALRAAAQEWRDEVVAPRWRGAVSARARRFRAGLHGGDCGQ